MASFFFFKRQYFLMTGLALGGVAAVFLVSVDELPLAAHFLASFFNTLLIRVCACMICIGVCEGKWEGPLFMLCI